ncbi:MAG TPA: DoxX family protein [Burkholderiales bacterium]|nr:DoxX family protein [Burkholderiales bacterium]
MKDSIGLQLFLIRIYVGLNFLPYAIQQLFMGKQIRLMVAQVYKQMELPYPEYLVIFVGICMLLAFLGLTLGFFTRLVAFLAFVFLIVAIFLGKHNEAGFFWFMPGGGWEFLAFWSFVCLSFILTGAGKYSIDKKMRQLNLPLLLRFLIK